MADVMHRERLPFCLPEASFRDVVHTITRGRLGLVLVCSPAHLSGIITDGDIRRPRRLARDRHFRRVFRLSVAPGSPIASDCTLATCRAVPR